MLDWSSIAATLRRFAVIAILLCASLGSTVDAAVCSTEGAALVAAVDVDGPAAGFGDADLAKPSADLPDESGDRDGPGQQHGMCAHGHCHHAGAGLPVSTTPEPDSVALGEHGYYYQHPLYDAFLKSLKRPPRA